MEPPVATLMRLPETALIAVRMPFWLTGARTAGELIDEQLVIALRQQSSHLRREARIILPHLDRIRNKSPSHVHGDRWLPQRRCIITDGRGFRVERPGDTCRGDTLPDVGVDLDLLGDLQERVAAPAQS